MITPQYIVDEQSQLLAAAAEPGGTTCPTCQQHAQIYDRRITAGMAAALIVMFREHSILTPFRMAELAKKWRSRDEAFLRHWGLIDTEAGGKWFVTVRGGEYVRGVITVPEVARIYNGELFEFTGPERSIYDALGRTHDYHRLMYG